MKQECTIGIDLGGTKTTFALLSTKGEIFKEMRIDTNSDGGEYILKDLIKYSEELSKYAQENNLELKAIGIGSPGRVDTKNGIVVDCTPNLKNWQGINIKEFFATHFDIPVFIDNDANVAAFGEYYLRKLNNNNNEKTIIILTLGTGLGSGIIYNEKVFRGKGLGSEIGHMILETKGRKCNCSQTGCFEMYVCGTAIETQAKNRLYKYPDSLLNKEEHITSYKVFELAHKKDLFCQIIIDEMAEYLAYGIISLINIFDPDLILLGGGISKQKDIYFNKMLTIINKEINYTYFNENIIQIAQSDEKAGLIGAGLIAFHGLETGEI